MLVDHPLLPLSGTVTKQQAFQRKVVDILLASWGTTTQKWYSGPRRAWVRWCFQRGSCPISASVAEVLAFLASLVIQGNLEYRTIALYTVQPKNNARARTSFCVRKPATSCGFLRLLAPQSYQPQELLCGWKLTPQELLSVKKILTARTSLQQHLRKKVIYKTGNKTKFFRAMHGRISGVICITCKQMPQ